MTPLTVAQLIEQLQQLPQHLIVYGCGNWYPIEKARIKEHEGKKGIKPMNYVRLDNSVPDF